MGSLLLLLLATGAAVLSLVSLSKAGLCAPTTSSFRHREEKERSAGENGRGMGMQADTHLGEQNCRGDQAAREAETHYTLHRHNRVV